KVWIDSNNDGVVQPDEFCIGGVDVTLTGMDIGNNAVNMTMTTDNDGNYQFAGLAPPLPGSSYRLAFDPSAETPFMLDGMDVIGTQGGVTGTNYFDISMPILGDVHGTGNNFALRGISPAYVSIWDILASQQGQLDQFGDVFYERLIVGVDGNGDEMFRINMGGWDNYSGIRVTNSDITGADVTGQLLNLSPTTRHVNRPLIRMMGELGVNGPRIYQIDGTGADTLSAAQPEGEGEASPEEALAIETMLAQLDSKASAEYADAVDAIFASDHTA
ncbi:MAG: SdrD B-like domain-containing protein, partial [Pirellulaceae bacterium]|nr:SdrD B-like domain-containing protein [Pirellulaceae bacterium]